MSAVLVVDEPGLFTTVQDLGRPGSIAAGVPPGGAMDRFAHVAANLLVGNERSAATLECTVTGPRLRAAQPCLVAIAGADLNPHINGQTAPMWAGIQLAAGDALSFGTRRIGARAYLAIAGGVSADRWLGSLSTNVMAGRGGIHGRALLEGDEIAAAIEPAPRGLTGRRLPETLRPDYADHTLYVIPGPHFSHLSDAGREALFGETFDVGRDANRMGYRLAGTPLEMSGPELLSFGLVAGALQVPPSGLPILLMADHQTAGGYPVVATVVSATLPTAAQLAPGDKLRFAEITFERALEMRAAQRAALDSLIN